MNKSIVKKVLVFLVPLVAVFLLYILAVYVANNISLPPCITYTLFHINCPGCGMTRSAIALLHFDFLLSLRQNAFIIVGIVLALMYYIELVLKVFGKNFHFPILSKFCGLTRNTFDSIIISAFIGLNAVAIYSNYYYIVSNIFGSQKFYSDYCTILER